MFRIQIRKTMCIAFMCTTVGLLWCQCWSCLENISFVHQPLNGWLTLFKLLLNRRTNEHCAHLATWLFQKWPARNQYLFPSHHVKCLCASLKTHTHCNNVIVFVCIWEQIRTKLTYHSLRTINTNRIDYVYLHFYNVIKRYWSYVNGSFIIYHDIEWSNLLCDYDELPVACLFCQRKKSQNLVNKYR